MRFAKKTPQYPYVLGVWIFVVCFLISIRPSVIAAGGDPLTPEEREWLQGHDGKITFSGSPDFPPIIFVDENGDPKGLTIDYVKLIEQKLNFKFRFSRSKSWKEVKAKLLNKEIDVIPDMIKSKDRLQYAQFSDFHFNIPSVIIVKNTLKKDLDIDDLEGMKVAVGNHFRIHEYLNKHHGSLDLSPQPNVKSCLLLVSTGVVDAVVADLGAASYIIEKEGITNLRVAGYLIDNQYHFASRIDWPILGSILNKGLALVTEEERDGIYRKWIKLDVEPFYKKRNFWFAIISALTLVSGVILLILIWNKKLQNEVMKRTLSLEQQTDTLQKEISIRKQAESELHLRERHLRTLIETIPDPVWLKDPEGFFVYCNPKFERLIGAKELILKGKTTHDFMDRELAEFLIENDKAALELRQSVANEAEFVYADDGHKEDLEIIKTPMYDQDDVLIGVLGVGRNITQRKKAQQALLRNRDLLESILSNIQGFTYRSNYSKTPIITFLTGHIEKLTGYPAEDFIDNSTRTYSSIIHPDDRKKTLNSYSNVMESVTPAEIEYRILHKNGATYWVYEKMVPIPEKGDRPDYLDGFVVNITKQKIMEEHFSQAQKMEAIGVLAGGIAHDFNNILGGILGFSELLQEDLEAIDCPEKMHRRIDNVIKGGIRAKELVAQILAFSRAESYQLQPVSVVIVVKEVIKLLNSTLPRNIEIRKSFTTNSMVCADITKIHQLLMNLCTNAGYAMKDQGGVLSIALQETHIEAAVVSGLEDVSPGKFLCITVEDTGQGMDEETRRKIMDPFFTTKPKGEGTGMGLWVVSGAVRDIGGFIEVSSKLDVGSRFDVYLPIFDKQKVPGPADAKQHSDHFTGEEYILYVDDEVTLTQLAKEFLTSLGYHVNVFNSAPMALEHFINNSDLYDIVMTDLTLPEMTGISLGKQIRSVRPDMKIILTTGMLEKSDEDQAKLFDSVLRKPVLIRDMAKTIRFVLDGNS